MGNFLDPGRYITIRGEIEIEINGTLQKYPRIFDPFERNPYVGVILVPVGFIFPAITIIGIIGNSLIITFMWSREVKVTRSARFFYLTVGLSDLVHNLFFGTLMGILMDALYMWTNKTFWLSTYPEDGAAFWCKLAGFGWYLSENYSNYSIMAFSLERVIIVYFPLGSRKFLSLKFSIILTLTCVVPAWLAMLPDNILLFTTIDDVGWSYTEFSCIEDFEHPFYAFNGIIFLVVLCLIHPLVTATCLLFILRKIRSAGLIRRQNLTNFSDKAFSDSAADTTTTLTLFWVGGLNVVIFIFQGIFWIGYVSILPIITGKGSLIGLFGIGNRIGSSLLNIVHSFNFYIYILLIPSFRDIILFRKFHPFQSA